MANESRGIGLRSARIGLALMVGAGALYLVPATGVGAVGQPTSTTSNVGYACLGVGNAAANPTAVPPILPIADQTTTIAITVPSSATVGETIVVGVDVGNLILSAAPSFLTLNAAGLIATIAVAGATAPATVSANNFIGNGASIDLAAASTTSIATAGTNTFTVGIISLIVGATGFVCTPTGTGASASVPVVNPPATTTTISGTTTTTAAAATTTTTAATTTTTAATTTTTAATTTTTAAPATTTTTTTTAKPATTTTQVGDVADQTPLSTTVNVAFACVGAGIIGPDSANAVAPIADQIVPVIVTRPTSVAAGKAFGVGIDVGNLKLSPAPDFVALNGAGVEASIAIAGATAPATGPADNFVGNGTSIDLTPASTTATAPGAPGTIVLTTGVVSIVSGATGFICTPKPVGAAITVVIVSANAGTVGSTTTSTAKAATTTIPEVTTPKTASTVPAAPAGTTAKIISKSAQITYTCDIVVSGSSLTPQTGPVTAIVSGPDKVGVGSKYQVSVAFDPGPKNGPIRFGPGLVSYSAELGVTGGAPSTVATSTAKNPDVIAASKLPDGPNVYHQVPSLTASVTAPSTVGGTVGIAPTKLVIAVPGQNSTTTCTSSTPVPAVLTSAVVAGVVTPAASVKGATSTTALAATGVETSTRTTIATILLAIGVLLLAASRRRATRRV